MGKLLSGSSPHQSFVMVHGGAGPRDPEGWNGISHANECLQEAVRFAVGMLETSPSVHLDLVERALRCMEDEPIFNAGIGSALQQDGIARLSASLMNGETGTFSGVVNISYTRNPSQLTRALQTRQSRVLGAPGHEWLARELGVPVADLVTPHRFERFVKNRFKNLPADEECDTVGAVAYLKDGRLAAGSSTGGKGYEYPGRVSDSCTVAGNYATRWAAITCTGIGEEIVDDAVAARMEARVRDGMSLVDASRKCYEEAEASGRQYGWIGCSHDGTWVAGYTTLSLPFCVYTTDGRILGATQA